MITDKILYKNAYKNLHAYYANIGYWNKNIREEIKDKLYKEYSYQTSRNIMNEEGFAICRYINKNRGKSILIFQYSPDEDDIKFPYNRYLTAWIKETEDKRRILVIYLLCTRDNVRTALNLIKLWVCEKDEELMNEINNIYKKHEQ